MAREIISNFLWKFFERIGFQAISFILSMILARILLPSDYGNIALIMVFISLANIIIEGGFNSALIQKKDCDELDYSTVLWTTVGFSTIIYILLYICAPYIGIFFGNILLCKILRVTSLILFAGAINSVQSAYLTRLLLFKKIFICSFISMIISAITGISLAYYGYGIWSLVIQQLVLSYTTLIIMFLCVDWKPKLEFSFDRLKTLYDFGWKIFATNLITSVFTNIRSLIIGKVYTASNLAFFDRGRSIPSLAMDNINSSIQAVLFPVLSRSQDKKMQIKNMMQKSIKLTSYLIYPLLIGLLVVSKPLIIVLLTDKWINAVPYLQIFCISYILMPIQNINMVAIKSLGYSSVLLRLEIIKKIIEIIILIISAYINVIAIAWGVVIYNFISIFINLYPTTKYLGYHYSEQLRDTTPSLLISILMGGLLFLLKSAITTTPIMNLIILTFLGVMIYILLSTIFKIQSFYYVLNIFNRKNKENITQ